MTTKSVSKNKHQKIDNPIDKVVLNFKETGKYSVAFLRDLKEGLSDLQKSKVWKSK